MHCQALCQQAIQHAAVGVAFTAVHLYYRYTVKNVWPKIPVYWPDTTYTKKSEVNTAMKFRFTVEILVRRPNKKCQKNKIFLYIDKGFYKIYIPLRLVLS